MTDQKKNKILDELVDQIIQVIKTIYDPEIPVNIYDLGLIYEISADELRVVEIDMTLTSPACPVAESLPIEVEDRVGTLPGVQSVKVNIVWDPPWSQEMMSEEARLELGLF